MDMEKIFEGKTSLAEYLPDKKRIEFTFIGYSNMDEHKEMYVQVLGFMKNNPVVAFLHDFRQMKGTFTQLNDWVIETFRPAVELGFKYDAMVLNDDVFTAFAANDVTKKVTLVEIQIFRELEDAEKWLDEKL